MGDLKYTLHIQRDNGRAKAQPEIRQNIYFETHNRICFAWVSEGVPASKPLHDSNISLHPNGLSVSGVERDGEVYHYQEWWLSPSMAAATQPITPPTPPLPAEPETEEDSSTLSEVRQAFDAIQAAKAVSPGKEPEVDFVTDVEANEEDKFESSVEEAALESEEELEIMEELGISPEPDEEVPPPADEGDDDELGGFDDLAVLSDSELDALADEPALEGDESDDMASIDGIDNVLDDAINEVLVDADDTNGAETQDEPEEDTNSGGVESAMGDVLKAAMKKSSEEDDQMLGDDDSTEDGPREEDDDSIMSDDELNAMLGEDSTPDEDI